MCWITGFIWNIKEKKEFINNSLEKIIHRWSSNFEYEIFDKAWLWTNRLPIVWRNTWKQPISNKKWNIFAVLNWEIFNYKELQIELEEKWYEFKTDSDTEVLVHLYEEYWEEMIHKLDSEMFVFIIYDVKENIFLVWKDKLWVKPLYYSIDKDWNYYFWSELKQLSQFDFLEEIFDFPRWNYMINWKLKQYYEIKISNSITDYHEAKNNVTKLLVEAIRKRVETDLPIAVLLSGWVDSSLIMEIACRFNKNVTAFILWTKNSSDYKAAVRLCEDKWYTYKIVAPYIDYEKEYENIIYNTELYEAQVIRQTFAMYILFKEIKNDGFKLAICWDWADEIFAWYNEFSNLNSQDINEWCKILTWDLWRWHNMRSDRMSMLSTVELRSPFFDNNLVDYAMNIDGSLKVKKIDHSTIVKYILREVAKDFLPDYIALRYKVPFANWAWMNVWFNYKIQDWDVARQVLKWKQINQDKIIKSKYNFITDEEFLYYDIYKKFWYNKLVWNEKRILTKETINTLVWKNWKNSLIIAEFGKIPLYFPLYFSETSWLSKKYNMNLSFVSTWWDNETYNSLISWSAQIWVSDPIFTFAENNFKVKWKIIASLINKNAICAVAIRPNISIKNIDDFSKYKVWAYQKFSTTNILSNYFLSQDIVDIDSKDIIENLKNWKIEIAIITKDLLNEVVSRWWKEVYTFDNEISLFLFTWLYIADNLDEKYKELITDFLILLRESLSEIKNNKEKAIEILKKEFPNLIDPVKTFEDVFNLWNIKLDINQIALKNSSRIWRQSYPELFKDQPHFLEETKEVKIIKLLISKNISRENPYNEKESIEIIRKSLKENKQIPFFTFWWASDKEEYTKDDIDLLENLKKINNNVAKLYEKSLNITFILSDKHAETNWYSKERSLKYLKSIEKLLIEYWFNFVYISDMWEKYWITINKIEKELEKLDDVTWNNLPNKYELEEASKNKWFKDYVYSAKKYYCMRILEKSFLEQEFKWSILINFSKSIHQNVIPDLPSFFFWTYWKWKSEIPWF